LPPEQRNIGMVFQSYAIWPHMTVAENVGFALRLRKVAAAERRERVKKALDLIGLPGFEDRPASRLSGGQQQRVALARALIYEPGLLLLDEPLSNLDAKLREQMQMELRLLQERLGLTVVYVTHDQTEALSMSDRIAVMNLGNIEQLDGPRALYERPSTAFVRDFLGKSVILSGKVRDVQAGRIGVVLGGGAVFMCHANGHAFATGHEVEISVRPEAVQAGRMGGDHNVLQGVVETILYQGERTECGIRVGGESIVVFLPPHATPARGQAIELSIAPEAISLWPKG
jgi:ABC-type Fe3+/spermidine/putrescine transport system ATPase subunit